MNVQLAVRADRLTRRFADLVAVDRLSIEVKPGELFGLVGPDGAGKTTTLRMLAGVMRPTAGDAEISGISVVKDPERVKHEIAYMSQRFGLYTDLTVAENLRFYADLYQVAPAEYEARLRRLFQFSNLEPFAGRLAGQLSGGMKQKLGLSCALIHQPRILLLDEPTFGVDPVSRRDLWMIVHEMVAEGVTVVVSTAYMDEAERFDRVALLHKGKVLAVEPPGDLRANFPGELLSVRVDRVRDARDAVLSCSEVRRAAVFGDRLHLTVDSVAAAANAVEANLSSAGFSVSHIEPIAPSMEDVFIGRVMDAESA